MSTPHLQTSETVLEPEEWVDAYGDDLYRYALYRLRDENAAEDVVQETFLAGLRYRKSYAGRGSQLGWLIGILRRKILDYLRKRQQRGAHSLEAESAAVGSSFDESGQWRRGVLPELIPEQAVESQELWAVVQGCLGRLPPQHASVFVLSVMEHMDSKEICKELEISPSNYWVRMHRARLELAKCVAAKWFSEAGEQPP